jgi:23S rRNA pseudouridine1911/1915/1917 synthase
MNENDPSDLDKEEYFLHREILVDKGQSPLRLDKFLLDKLNGISRNKIQQAINASSVLVNDKEVKSNYKVRPGDRISIVLPEPPKEFGPPTPENIPLNIIYEDGSVIIVNKPAGMVVHPGVGNRSGTLVNALVYYLEHSDVPVMEGNTADRPGLVHRIDKNTSGLLVIAKTESAMTHLAKQFFHHSIDRSYRALVWGTPKPASGVIDMPIGRDPRYRKKMSASIDLEYAKRAITHYKTIEDLYYVSLVECVLETGRTHQIRVHMQSIGHPVFSDEKYGGDSVRKGTIFTKYKQFVDNCFKIMPRQALHAATLGFIHPETKEYMKFEAPLPEDFEQVLERWRKYVQTRRKLNLDE